MTRIAKLHAQFLANPNATHSFRDFERLIVAFGFELRRTAGSHRHYARADVPYIVTVQPHGKDAMSYQIRRFLAICAEYGLTLDD